MDDRYTLLKWGVMFLAFAVIVCVVRARREKEKDKDYYKGFYLAAGAGLLMLLFVVSVILQQPLLAWFFLFSGGAVAIVGMPTTDKFIGRLIADSIQGVDVSAPLRGRELLSLAGLLKTAYRWGVWKAIFLFWLLMAAVIVGVLLILGLWFGWIRLGWISVDSIVAVTFSSTIPITAMYYRAISKGLRSIEKPKESGREDGE